MVFMRFKVFIRLITKTINKQTKNKGEKKAKN